MNKTKGLLFSLPIAALCLLSTGMHAADKQTDYTKYVNPFVGNADNGHTFPGACRPFGMIQTSPVTGGVGWRYCAEYVYSDSIIWGFTQDHLNGTGCMDLGDILVMPSTGSRTRQWDQYRSHYVKTQEFATPGYYSVYLSDAKVKAELTATPHVAFHRYTYDSTDSTSVLIDLQHGPAWNDKQYHSQVNLCETRWEDANTLVGHVQNTVWVKQDYFFVIKFNRPVASHITLAKAADTEKGERIVATFDGIDQGEQLLMKIAMSTTSIDGAKKNLQAELPGWDFAAVKTAAHDDWNAYLKRIDIDGTEEQKQKYLVPLANGTKLGAFGLTEPGAGTDAQGCQTKAVLDGDEWVLNGSKCFITNGKEADIYIIIAVTSVTEDKKGRKKKNFSAFIVEKGTPGFTFGTKEKKMGIRGSATYELIFQDCRIPKENLLGPEGRGFPIAMHTLDGGRIGIAAQALGIAEGALETTINYVKERKQFGRSIAAQQNTQFVLADMATKVEAAKMLVYKAAQAKATQKTYSFEAAQAKLFAAEVAMEVTTKAVQLHGGYGYIREYDVERMMRDAKITEIYEGTSEVQRMVISGTLLK